MKSIVFVVLIACGVLCSQAVYAHPPAKIVVTFDGQTRILEAVITHPVTNGASHYIVKVDIALNDTEVVEHHISRQDNNATQTIRYLIPDAKKGDVLSVEAYCNISGKRVQQITVE